MDADKLAKGMSDSGAHVREFLFDYLDLTHLERTAMKRGMPFYTWMRKNIPLQVENLVNQPQKYIRLSRTEDNLYPWEPGEPAEAKYVPAWMQKEGYRKLSSKLIPTDWKTEGTDIFFKIDLPADDLRKMTRLSTYVSSINPAATVALAALNIRAWPQASTIGSPGKRARAPFWASMLPKKLRSIADVGLMADKKTGNLIMGMDPVWRDVIKSVVPLLSDWERAYPTAGTIASQDETGKWAKVSYLTGISFKALNKQEAQYNEMIRLSNVKRSINQFVKSHPTDLPESMDRFMKKMKSQ